MMVSEVRFTGQTGDVHPLIDVPSLARLIRDTSPPVVLDVRWHLGGPPGIEVYRKGHLPGAVFVDLDRDLSGPAGPAGRHPLPAKADFQEAMRRAGGSAGPPRGGFHHAGSPARPPPL